MCATSGVAASNFVGGMTLHAFCGLPISLDTTSVQPSRQVVLKQVDCIVVDEACCATDGLFDALEVCLRKSRGNLLPFGGVRIIWYISTHTLIV